MNRTETLADIASRYPAIPANVAEKHWRKSDAFLRMLNRKHAAHTDVRMMEAVQALVDDAAKGSRESTRMGLKLETRNSKLGGRHELALHLQPRC